MRVAYVKTIKLEQPTPVYDLTVERHHNFRLGNKAFVHNSHIDCLLLTLFYTHLRPLIERGHVYIAKPPLFKITRGSTKRYAVTQGDLDKFVATNAAKVDLGLGIAAVSSAALAACAREYLAREQVLAGEAGMSPKDLGRLCTAIWGAANRDGLEGEDPRWGDAGYYASALAELCRAQGCEAVKAEPGDPITVSGLDPEEGRYFTAKVDSEAVHAVNELLEWLDSRLGRFCAGVEEASTALNELLCATKSANGPCDLHKAAEMASREATRGITVSRMKGLGEMQPDELWETALDPTKRILVQIGAADVALTGSMIRDLMSKGDSEPRKALIRSIEAGEVSIDV